MFEVGKDYRFRIIVDGAETIIYGNVEAFEPPLVKTRDVPMLKATPVEGEGFMPFLLEDDPTGKVHRGLIINTASSNFISAVIDD